MRFSLQEEISDLPEQLHNEKKRQEEISDLPEQLDIEKKRQNIISKMDYDRLNSTLIIWSLVGLLSPDFIQIFLKKFHPAVRIRHHWSQSVPGVTNLVTSSTAIFSDSKAAELASRNLQMSSRSIIAISLFEFFHALVKAEIQHCFSEGIYTELVIKGKEYPTNDGKLILEQHIKKFGTYESIQFSQLFSKYGIICKVLYHFAAHAIVAKSVLDGFLLEGTGRISVEVTKSLKVRRIVEFARCYCT